MAGAPPPPDLGAGLAETFRSLGSAALWGIPIVAVLVVVFLLARMTRRGGGGFGGLTADLYVLEVDENRREVIERPYTRIGTSSYAYIGPDGPRFLEVTPNTYIYKCVRGRSSKPCVLAYPRDILAIPIKPELAAATHLLLASEGMFNVDKEEDAVAMLKALYDRLGRSEKGYVVLEGPTRVLFSFNLRRILTELIDSFAVDGATFIKHVLSTIANVQTLERLYKALSQYAESRMKWLGYLAVLGMVIAIGAAIAFIFMGNQPARAPVPGVPGG